MFQIVNRQQFSDVTFLWDVFAPDVAAAARPGQFIMLRLEEGGERVPLTIADYDVDRGTVTLVIQALGKSTQQMLGKYKKGDWFQDFVGPLGLESEIENFGHVVMVGGGLGVAPVYPQLRAFKEAGNKVTGIIGFRSKEFVFWEDRFRNYCDELIVCTDDGSYGRPGFVTVALEDVLRRDDPPKLAVAIGPLPMMKACADVTRPFGVKTIVSLNAIMVDGTGMCGSCRVTVGGKTKFACVDGPDFDAHGVNFPELMARQARFKKHEHQAQDDFAHLCNLEQQLIEEGKRNYKKLKEIPATAHPMPERDAQERAANFLEVNLGYSMDTAMAEAERCLQCRRPTCVTGCPVGIDIPRFIRHLLLRDLTEAQKVIHESNLFPSICGRVCPQESQCESQCILRKKMEPVAIGRLERFIGDNAPPASGTNVEKDPGMGKVAIVGSGPAGLACAGDMARAGADVTVYEALHVVGGVLQYGIPPFRLPRDIIAREVRSLEQLGVRFEINKVVGKTFTVHQLMKEKGYSAVFVGTGAGYPSFPGIPGESAGQVYSANEFLTRVNLMGGNKFPFKDTPVAMGDRVVVIGAGNTAMDCLRVSKRIGAKDVNCIYRRTEAEAPARIEELRHAREEGINFHWLRSPVEIKVNDDGDITSMIVQKMKLGEPDASGRRRPVPIEGELEEFECDTVIVALGTQANPIVPQSTKGLELNKWGNIVADPETQATNIPGLFAGGDIVSGGATVILALGAGRRAASAMQTWLKQRSWPPEPVKKEAVQTTTANTCPKCHEPIEPGESYICCAGDKLSWRCTQCGKVYEGFAFPYGLCAACGGTLEKADATETASNLAKRAIRHAFEIELGGMAFYQGGAKAAKDEDLRKLFEGLAEMEREHLKTLSRRYHVSPPDLNEEKGLTSTQMAVYAGIETPMEGGVELLELALTLEKRARDFFAGQVSGLTRDTQEWRLYRELEAEEWEHVAMIGTELTRWKEGKRGLL